MGHHSRVCAVLVDVDVDAYRDTAQFWSAALGRPMNFDSTKRYFLTAANARNKVAVIDTKESKLIAMIETDGTTLFNKPTP